MHKVNYILSFPNIISIINFSFQAKNYTSIIALVKKILEILQNWRIQNKNTIYFYTIASDGHIIKIGCNNFFPFEQNIHYQLKIMLIDGSETNKVSRPMQR